MVMRAPARHADHDDHHGDTARQQADHQEDIHHRGLVRRYVRAGRKASAFVRFRLPFLRRARAARQLFGFVPTNASRRREPAFRRASFFLANPAVSSTSSVAFSRRRGAGPAAVWAGPMRLAGDVLSENFTIEEPFAPRLAQSWVGAEGTSMIGPNRRQLCRVVLALILGPTVAQAQTARVFGELRGI